MSWVRSLAIPLFTSHPVTSAIITIWLHWFTRIDKTPPRPMTETYETHNPLGLGKLVMRKGASRVLASLQ